MPTRDEEEAEQEAAERLDVGLELVAEGRIRQHQAGDERAHRHRHAGGSISAAAPSTTSKAAAVITSRARSAASMRKNGLSR